MDCASITTEFTGRGLPGSVGRSVIVKYLIKDYEIRTETEVEAPGFLEAMLEYLPWPTIQVDFDYSPTMGEAFVIDQKTDFKYRVRIAA